MSLIKKKPFPEHNQVAPSEFTAMMDAYSDFVWSQSDVELKLRELKKNTEHFLYATVFAKRHRLSPSELIELVSKKLSSALKRRVIPLPKQLHGGSVLNYVAEKRANDRGPSNEELVARARTCATTNRFKDLEDDDVFRKSKSKLKPGTFTAFDVTYLKERYIQCRGEVPAWMAKYENKLKGGSYEQNR